MDGIEDDGHAFQFNVEQRETKTNVTGTLSGGCTMDNKRAVLDWGQIRSKCLTLNYSWLNKHIEKYLICSIFN